jgi:hypothetical protein
MFDALLRERKLYDGRVQRFVRQTRAEIRNRIAL